MVIPFPARATASLEHLAYLPSSIPLIELPSAKLTARLGFHCLDEQQAAIYGL